VSQPNSNQKNSNAFGKRTLDTNLVLKLAPHYWLMAEIAHDKGKPYVKNLLHAPLPRQVDPNRPNIDLEILQDTLVKLVDDNGFDGRDVTVLLPSSCSVVHTHTVPFDLEKKADIKEFLISSGEREFWQEFEPDVQDVKLPVFGAQYLAPGSEEGTSQVFVSWANQDLLNKYIDLALSARMQPVALVPELQAVLNLLIPQLDRLERESYFGLLHLARGRSKLLAVGPERIASANLNISELDEELLDEIESVDDVSNEFWGEVGARVGSSLKQAVMYLREQEGIPPIRNIYVISEASVCVNILSLIKANFNLGSLKGWQPLNQIATNGLATSGAISKVPNQTVWASLIGGGLQGLQPSRLMVPVGESPRFQLNLHPQRDKLCANRRYRALAKKANWASFALVALFSSWAALDIGPDYFRLQRTVQAAQTDLQQLTSKQQELTGLNASIQAEEAKIANLAKADVINAKSKFVMTLPSLLPQGVELSAMNINDAKITLSGVALNTTGPQSFFNNLANSKLVNAPVLEVNGPQNGKISFSIQGFTGMVN
jgi:Tfp pilus assembly protein PilN